MGRYTLVSNYTEVPNFKKVYLEDIDMFTTTNEDLEKTLTERGIRVSNLHISYKVNKELRELEVLGEEYNYLNDIKVEKGKIDIRDSTFLRKVGDILDEVRYNKRLENAIYSSYGISDKVKEYIRRALEENTYFCYNKLLEHLSSYIQFRRLVLFVDEFVKPKVEKVDETPTVKTSTNAPVQKPLFDINPNNEDIEDNEIDPDEDMYNNWDDEERKRR